MKKSLLFILFLLMISTLFSQEKRFIGVLGLEQSSLSEEDANILTDRLRYELFKTDKFTVLERDKMEEIMSEQSFQLSGCTSTECLVEVGKLIGVNEIAGGRIGKFGNTFTINVRLIDVETGQITANAVFDLSGSKDDLLTKGMKKVARELAGLKTVEVVGIPPKKEVSIADSPTKKSTSAPQVRTKNSNTSSAGPVVKRTNPYLRTKSTKKKKKNRMFAIYPSIGAIAAKIKSDKIFDDLSDKVEVDFKGALAGVMGEVFLTQKLGIFLGIFTASETFDEIKIGSLTQPTVDYDVDITMFYWGLDFKPNRFTSMALGFPNFQIEGKIEDYYGVDRGKTTNDNGIHLRCGLHLPLTEWLNFDSYLNFTGGEQISGTHYLFCASLHF